MHTLYSRMHMYARLLCSHCQHDTHTKTYTHKHTHLLLTPWCRRMQRRLCSCRQHFSRRHSWSLHISSCSFLSPPLLTPCFALSLIILACLPVPLFLTPPNILVRPCVNSMVWGGKSTYAGLAGTKDIHVSMVYTLYFSKVVTHAVIHRAYVWFWPTRHA